jgi:GNAT superfamily N-acetyltransferase
MKPAVVAPANLRFGPDWSEDVELASGERVRLRTIRADDKERIKDGLLRLSPQSQYLRFFTTKARFTASELRYLTELDGWDHFAIGAAKVAPDGSEGEGVAVARFVRLPGERAVAEPAIAVVDEMQRKGLGRVLLLRLVAAAIERDVAGFRTEFLAVNDGMRDLLQSVAPSASFVADGAVVTAEFPLPGAAPDHAIAISPHVASLHGSLRMAANRWLELRRLFELLFDADALQRAWHELQRRLGLGDAPR